MRVTNHKAIPEVQQHAMRAGSRMAWALLAFMVLLLPLCASAEKTWKEGKLLLGPAKAKDTFLGSGYSQVKSRNWVMIIKVGNYTYGGVAQRNTGWGKGPQPKDWPLDSTLQVHFHRSLGSLFMDLVGPTGKKEEDVHVVSKIGPDGEELCGKIKCTKTAEDAEN